MDSSVTGSTESELAWNPSQSTINVMKHQGSSPLVYLELHSPSFALASLQLRLFIAIFFFKFQGGIFYIMRSHELGSLGMCAKHVTFLLINELHFLLHILLHFMTFAHSVSRHKETDACGFNLWELFVRMNRFQQDLSNAELCHRTVQFQLSGTRAAWETDALSH